MSYETSRPETRALLQRIDALSEDDVRFILAFFAGYQPDLLEEQIARREARRVQVTPCQRCGEPAPEGNILCAPCEVAAAGETLAVLRSAAADHGIAL